MLVLYLDPNGGEFYLFEVQERSSETGLLQLELWLILLGLSAGEFV